MTLPEVARKIQRDGGKFSRASAPHIFWTIEKDGHSLINGLALGKTMPVAFLPTGDDLVADDYQWVHP